MKFVNFCFFLNRCCILLYVCECVVKSKVKKYWDRERERERKRERARERERDFDKEGKEMEVQNP